jgi:hypothetical protein
MTTEAFQEALAEIVSVIGAPDYQDQNSNDAMWETSGEGRYLLFDEEPGTSPSVTFVVTWGKPTVQASSEWRVDRSPDAIAPTLAATMAVRWLMQKLYPATPQAPSSTTKTKRKAISKAVRFEVFKRDKFTCQYCGAKAPDVMLECDHITPHSLTQDNSILNLVTACHACNNGKSDKVLSDDSAIAKQHAQLSQLQERRDQLEMMMQWQRSLVSLDTETVTEIVKFFDEFLHPWSIASDDNIAIIRKSLKKYTPSEVMEIIRDVTTQHIVMAGSMATPESSQAAATAFFNELKYRKGRQEDPEGTSLYYIRAIVRNRSTHWNDYRSRTCLDILRDALSAGVTVEEMKSIAKRTDGWTAWANEMSDRSERAKGSV